MSTLLEQLRAQAALAAQTGPNMTEVVAGGSGQRLLPEGNGFLQLVEYIEYGTQPQEFKGVAKEPAPAFSLAFAVSGNVPDPANPGTFLPLNNDDGTPYLLRMFSMAMSRNEKAKAFLLFKAMNWKGTATHFAQLIGEKFIGRIVTYTSKTPGAKPRSIIDAKTILPPLDLMSGQPYAIPDAPDSYYRLFLWDHPTVEAWDALYIDGEFEAKDGKPARSKNFVQEEILGAFDFPGSPLEQMLKASGKKYTVPPKPVAAAAPAAAPAGPAMAMPPAVPPAAPAVVVATPAMPAPAGLPFDNPTNVNASIAPSHAAPTSQVLAAPATVSPAPAAVASPSVVAPAPVVAPVVVAAPAAASPSPVAMPAMPVMPA